MAAHCLCVLLTAYLLTVYLWKITDAQKSGPYKVIMKELKNCPDKGSGEMSVRSTARGGGDTYYHTGELRMPHGLKDDGFKAVGEASIQKDGKWQPIGLISRLSFPKACSSTKQMAPVWFDILTAADAQTDCPVPKGNYQFKNYTVGPTLNRISELKYGKYRIRMDFVRQGKKIGCMEYGATVVPST